MIITFKLVKNSLKFLMCFTVILLVYYYQNYFTTRPRQWTLVRTIERFRSNFSQITKINDIKIMPNSKYILIWTKDDTFAFLEKGQAAFINNNCSFTNCYVTVHRNMLHNDYTNFHAILFSGKKVARRFEDGYMKLPKKRLANQTYIFAMQEDAVSNPICAEQFDNYFNMTWTYKLNSDANWSHFKVIALDGKSVIAPTLNPNWTTEYQDYNMFSEIKENIFDKQFYGVWTSSICETHSRREEIVKQIKEESKKYQNMLHTVGYCGSKECSVTSRVECMSVYDNYNFYLAFEAVMTEDYVTNEILDAFAHYCVPVVYGATNYSRFLPPHSYIDARILGVQATAKLMDFLNYNVSAFFEYHEWRTSYRIVKNHGHAACDLCEAMNKQGHKVYKEFRKWWNPDYQKMCKTKRKRYLFKRSNRRKTVKYSTWNP